LKKRISTRERRPSRSRQAQDSLIGMIEDKNGANREAWLTKMRAFGRNGE